MLTNRSWLMLGLLCGGGCTSNIQAADKGFALVELFTSEGCSSCPPADALLADLAADAKKSGRHVYCLSFHVDYWNQLGWRDRFSDPAFTQRQKEYAESLKLKGIYTPQMVINGADEFVGSNRQRAAKSIESFLSTEPLAVVKIQSSADNQVVTVNYQVKNAPADAVLSVAWTEAEAASSPDRGENLGAKLRHVNVVRDFRTIELNKATEGKLLLKRMDVKSGTVVAFVQEAKLGRILAATAAEVAGDR